MSLIYDNCLYPAVPVTFRKDGSIDYEAELAYAKWMNTQPITGVALWAHTGRGLHLLPAAREKILLLWREALDPEKKIICGAGGKGAKTGTEFIDQAYQMGLQAKELGADGLLCYAPVFFRGQANQDEWIVKYHSVLDSLDLPLVLFYLYESAGGISYSLDVLKQLFALKNAEAIKMATLDSVMTYQDIANLMAKEFPHKTLITGEDRMFGYTISRGAKGALVGIGSAFPALQKAMIDAFYEKDYEKFIRLTLLIDKLAEVTFTQPMEGYIARMLYVLVLQGLIPSEAAFDPYGPEITEKEKLSIKEVVQELEEAKW